MNRKRFLVSSLLGVLGGYSALIRPFPLRGNPLKQGDGDNKNALPLVISTWDHGLTANEEAWKVLSTNGRAVDAVEKGVRIVESDPGNRSVGLGGLPDREGIVTLDASIMDDRGNAGSVCFLQDIENPVTVARLVMDKTPHVMLAGEGARRFAIESGIETKSLLTEETIKAYEEWKEKSEYKPVINSENHDTIGMLAIDKYGNLSGACTTSGLAFKYHGRVGDSPVIGAGLYVDNKVGGATATGLGELVMKTVGSFLVVEMMRQGYSPGEACRQAILRIVDNIPDYEEAQVGYIAVNKAGEWGAYAIHGGFNYAVRTPDLKSLVDSDYFLK